MISTATAATITTYQPICSICAMPDLVLPCQTCHRRQCETCFTDELRNKRECEGCRLERFLEMDKEYSFKGYFSPPSSPSEGDEKEEAEPGVPSPSLPSSSSSSSSSSCQPCSPPSPSPSPSSGVFEVFESGIILTRPLWYPTEEEWRYTGQVLESHILFTSSSAGPSPPVLYMKYLVGRVYDPYTGLTTEYMMAYEAAPSNPSYYMWNRYMSTYYMLSAMPWERDLFFPYGLPLPGNRS